MERNSEKTVLKKMILMYIRENINTNLNHSINIDVIVEEVVRELMNNRNSKTHIYGPGQFDQSKESRQSEEMVEFIYPPSPQIESVHTYDRCITRQSILFRCISRIYEYIMKKCNDQDTHQRYQAVSSLLFELFRAITSSLMILFVPQNCKGDICNLNDMLVIHYDFRSVGLVINFITLFSFTILYSIELWRENRLIKYLDVNPNLPTDIDYISTIMDIIPEDKKQKLLSSNTYYKYITYTTIIIYIINAIISGIIINNSFLNSQTHSTYITYVIFMITKLSNAYGVITSDNNLYYSAYLKTNIQFNDIDRHYKKIIKI